MITWLKQYYIIPIVIVSIGVGITATLIAQKCDVEAAMKPLVFVINELSGRRCK